MYIESQKMSKVPLNGAISISTYTHDHTETVNLDFMDWYPTPQGQYEFKCFDLGGTVVCVRIDRDLIEHVVFGDMDAYTPPQPGRP